MTNRPRTPTGPPALACALALAVVLSACSERRAAPAAAAPPASAAVVPLATTTVGMEVDDTIVTARVKSALLADARAGSMDVKVETRKGRVQLSGFVGTQAQIDAAIAIAGAVDGVRGVENGMSLKDGKATVGNAIDDSVVTARVRSALLSDPDVKSFDIGVVTRRGQVQLSGYVDSQAQIDRALVVARGIEGAQDVGNEMSVKK